MSKSFEIEGTLVEVMETMTFASGFTKREFILREEDDRYPQDIKMTLTRNQCSLIDAFKKGDQLRVTFSLRGNKWQDRYFTDLQAFKVERVETDGSTVEPIEIPEDDFTTDSIPDDDMPF
ncbi:MAG: DUF3127 domain-containing protein [bacterium]|nr:DUF3127 domain-containing protein [bacterium]MDO5462080.1 DUF3127 domain-containing protein [bacterium]